MVSQPGSSAAQPPNNQDTPCPYCGRGESDSHLSSTTTGPPTNILDRSPTPRPLLPQTGSHSSLPAISRMSSAPPHLTSFPGTIPSRQSQWPTDTHQTSSYKDPETASEPAPATTTKKSRRCALASALKRAFSKTPVDESTIERIGSRHWTD